MNITVDEAEVLTSRLVSFPSMTETKDVLACAEYIKQWFIEQKIDAEIVTYENVPNVVAHLGKKGEKRLLLNGHFDVVPPGDLSEWQTNPFEPFCKEGYIYGRGVSDMKSGIAAAMLAMKKLKQCEEMIDGEIVFYGVGDEETGSVHGTVALLENHDKNFNAAIVPEPTDFCIERAQRGLRWIEFHIKGKACHAGRPHVGKNAIEQAAKVINELKKIKYDIHEEIFEDGLQEPSLSVNRIQGGIKNNIVAEECDFLIDRRMLPGESVEMILSQIKDATDRVMDEGFTYDMKLYNNGWDPFITDAENAIVLNLVKSYEKVTGEKPVVRGKGGCTDASHIYNVGIPVVILGPGSANESHTSNEKCELGRIAATAKILADVAVNYLKQ